MANSTAISVKILREMALVRTAPISSDVKAKLLAQLEEQLRHVMDAVAKASAKA